MSEKLFEWMDDHSKRFYSRVFNTVILNSYAVRRGYFDTLFCETEDPAIMLRWREALPQIVALIQQEKLKGLQGDDPGN